MLRPVLAALSLALLITDAPAQEPAAADPGASARTEIAPKVAAARAILDGWQAKDPARAERRLHIVYWTPADREPAPLYREPAQPPL